MNYDNWKTTEPDPYQDDERDDDERPCDACGALADEPCRPWCDTNHGNDGAEYGTDPTTAALVERKPRC